MVGAQGNIPGQWGLGFQKDSGPQLKCSGSGREVRLWALHWGGQDFSAEAMKTHSCGVCDTLLLPPTQLMLDFTFGGTQGCHTLFTTSGSVAPEELGAMTAHSLQVRVWLLCCCLSHQPCPEKGGRGGGSCVLQSGCFLEEHRATLPIAFRQGCSWCTRSPNQWALVRSSGAVWPLLSTIAMASTGTTAASTRLLRDPRPVVLHVGLSGTSLKTPGSSLLVQRPGAGAGGFSCAQDYKGPWCKCGYPKTLTCSPFPHVREPPLAPHQSQ